MIYGKETIKPHPNLKIFTGDIRDQGILKKSLEKMDAVIHLACISNDPSFELNKELGKDINLNAFRPLVELSVSSGVRRFIYASSSSVYGLKKEQNVDEEVRLEPLTDYSKYKVECEKILFNYQSDNFTTVVTRPATVCGYSPRQRLDLVVNILTNLAYHKREISIFGGDQLRPNIHIDDMADAYLLFLKTEPKLIAKKIYNIGFENHKVSNLAATVKGVVGEDVKLIPSETDDKRSYHISSKKIERELNFKAKKNIRNAVEDLVAAFKEKLLLDPLKNEFYYNIQRMKSINLK